MSDHTPEPWKWHGTIDDLGEQAEIGCVLECAGGYLADANGTPLLVPADAESYSASLCASPGVAARIVACVNACAGLSNEELGGIAGRVEAHSHD